MKSLWLLLFLLIPTPLGASQDILPELVRRIKPSAVAIETFDSRGEKLSRGSGFFVDVDVSIVYRIVNPFQVFTKLGPGRAFEDSGIVPKAEPVLKQALGELTTEEFYNSPLRAAKAARAKEILNKELAQYGLTVDQVLVRYFRYTEEIQKNIEEKKLKDQLVFKNQAEGRASTEGANLKKIIQEGAATVDIKLQEGQSYVTRKEAERDLYVRKRRAEADLLVKLAEAKRTQLRNDAFQGGGPIGWSDSKWLTYTRDSK